LALIPKGEIKMQYPLYILASKDQSKGSLIRTLQAPDGSEEMLGIEGLIDSIAIGDEIRAEPESDQAEFILTIESPIERAELSEAMSLWIWEGADKPDFRII
jgi:hypothetical protein